MKDPIARKKANRAIVFATICLIVNLCLVIYQVVLLWW